MAKGNISQTTRRTRVFCTHAFHIVHVPALPANCRWTCTGRWVYIGHMFVIFLNSKNMQEYASYSQFSFRSMFEETPIKFVVEKKEKDLHMVAIPFNKSPNKLS